MIIFISGGCKNGKSMLAQHLTKTLCKNEKLYYVATMIPHDDEDHARIRRHIADRDGWGYETVECGRKILSCLDKADKRGTFLLDSVTALISNEMFHDGGIDIDSAVCVSNDLCTFAESVANIVLVSDHIFCDCEKYDELTEEYRRCLALADRKLCEIADTVIEVCAGNYSVLKGEMPL